MKLSFLTLLFLALPQFAFGVVDMRLANYSDTWTDLELPGTGYDLKVVRTYNSRSLFNGMFGFGWCSDFETAFKIQSDGAIHLKECGDGKLTIYLPSNYSPNNSQSLVDQIMAKVKSDIKNPTEKALSSIRSNLLTNPRVRQEYADRYKLGAEQKKGALYRSTEQTAETLALLNDYYERSFADGAKQRFDLNGRMTHMYDRNGNFLKLNYDGSNLRSIVDNNGRQLAFTHYENGKVKEIRGPGGLFAAYKFEKLSDLAYVRSAWGNEYTYKYDELHNLVRVNFPDKTFKELTYNTNKDWVTSFRGRNGCLETYKYNFDPKDPNNHYWSDVEKKCGGKVDTIARFEFWFKARKGYAGKFLARSYSKINKDVSDVEYSEEFGKPIKTVENGRTTTYSYYANGLLKERKSGSEVASFRYNQKFNKVSSVQIGAKKTDFEYDNKGNLVFAKSTSGQFVRLEYDPKGRITSLVDQAKRVVKITYDPQLGKPSVVERPGVGKISVAYKPNGEIKTVDSKDGPTVASQIAATFSSLLEVVSPAGVDLGL
jgi:YD repeat-containing protein